VFLVDLQPLACGALGDLRVIQPGVGNRVIQICPWKVVGIELDPGPGIRFGRRPILRVVGHRRQSLIRPDVLGIARQRLLPGLIGPGGVIPFRAQQAELISGDGELRVSRHSFGELVRRSVQFLLRQRVDSPVVGLAGVGRGLQRGRAHRQGGGMGQ